MDYKSNYYSEIAVDAENYDDSVLIDDGKIYLKDGREIQSAVWGECGYTFLTYTFLADNIENNPREQIVDYLIEQGVKIDSEKYIGKIDSSRRTINNKEYWEVTMVIGEYDE